MRKKVWLFVIFLPLIAIIAILISSYVNAECADFDSDGNIGFNDFFLFSENFGKDVNAENKQYDLSGNGFIDFDDFFIFSEQFGNKCGVENVQVKAGETSSLELPSELSSITKDMCRDNLELCYKKISYINAVGKIAKLENGKLEYYHGDNLGSAARMTDENGEIVYSAEYLPFGEEFNKDGESKYGYTGKELDDESGLNYYGARYYDSEVGRFVSVDPLADGMNRYVYVGNNPLSNVDPDGAESIAAIMGVEKGAADFQTMRMAEIRKAAEQRILDLKERAAALKSGTGDNELKQLIKETSTALDKGKYEKLIKQALAETGGDAKRAAKLLYDRGETDVARNLMRGVRGQLPSARRAAAIVSRGENLGKLGAAVAVGKLVTGSKEEQGSAALSLVSQAGQMLVKAGPVGGAVVGILATPTATMSGGEEREAIQQVIQQRTEIAKAKKQEERRMAAGLRPN